MFTLKLDSPVFSGNFSGTVLVNKDMSILFWARWGHVPFSSSFYTIPSRLGSRMIRIFVSIRMAINSNHSLTLAVLMGKHAYRLGLILPHGGEAVIGGEVLSFQSLTGMKSACNPIFSLEIWKTLAAINRRATWFSEIHPLGNLGSCPQKTGAFYPRQGLHPDPWERPSCLSFEVNTSLQVSGSSLLGAASDLERSAKHPSDLSPWGFGKCTW